MAQIKIRTPKEQPRKGTRSGEIETTSWKECSICCFLGNLPYTIDKDTLKTHFDKAGQIRDVRIVKEKGSNRPKGFAYVELTDPESYQRALSLHHSMVGGRRINVLYTQPGHKKSAEAKKIVKQKNFKLGAMRKQGMLAGSVKQTQSRNARRNKAKGKDGAKKHRDE
ncbi:uncharacterized RNA-binding protein C365.04c-like [Ctenocephalides felis]|uniref:uncharacterized RNA-binding protein C365.04c-like n=1 Tax=Ctenocephalides felis TaxID=7515 RepID=UPI000E6E4D48|nr:uncharacterized RNA-binding protein C365.04c-like [Ctenocephalides felis]